MMRSDFTLTHSGFGQDGTPDYNAGLSEEAKARRAEEAVALLNEFRLTPLDG